MDLPDPEPFHAAALGCSVAVVTALELNQTTVAAKMAALGVMFESFARAIERMAARRPIPSNIARVHMTITSVSSERMTPTVTVAGTSSWSSGSGGTLTAA